MTTYNCSFPFSCKDRSILSSVICITERIKTKNHWRRMNQPYTTGTKISWCRNVKTEKRRWLTSWKIQITCFFFILFVSVNLRVLSHTCLAFCPRRFATSDRFVNHILLKMLRSISVVDWMALRYVHKTEYLQHDRQCMCDIPQRRFRLTVVVVDK